MTLVLGGLGLRGVANIGCLQALHDRGAKIDRIVSTGIGGVIAVQFALGRDPAQLIDRFARFFSENDSHLWGLHHVSGVPRPELRKEFRSLSQFLRRRLFCELSLNQVSVLPGELPGRGLTKLFGDLTTADLRIPVTICAINVNRREQVPLSEGKLVDLVQAGVAFPGLFPPVSIGGEEYVSSALYSELPLDCAPESNSSIVAIDMPQAVRSNRPRCLLEILTRADEGRTMAMKEILLSRADIVVRLESTRRFSWGSYRRLPQLVQLVREELNEQLAHLEPGLDWLS